ncbi:glutamate--cysteine ligase [Azohydromonas australica]|uniref:glutamate--cysteine ligase n=1 Tax=Azohydromonas australica TaxID=364039 RepID=UPI0004032F08|nr:glutamate--cysteine ligase [Azohydromonas australica]
MVPSLVTALSGPLSELERTLVDAAAPIERWFEREWLACPAPFYASVDVRHAGFKLAPVDTNLYPGGWNNLSPVMLARAAQAAREALRRSSAADATLLLIPENHTRNLFYLSNVARLQQLLQEAGLQVRVGSLLPELKAATEVALPDGTFLRLEPLRRRGARVGLDGFDPALVLLNNDLTAGVPLQLQDLHGGQALLPPLHAGWHVRRKSTHFRHHEAVATRLARLLGMDPWLLHPLSSHCGGLDFAEGIGLQRLQHEVDLLLGRIRASYAEHGIALPPFVVVKADNGTYGMGIMTVRDAAELSQLGRRARNKMHVIKDGRQTSDVIVQEGVPTCEQVAGGTAETVVYLMDHQIAGAFHRVHAERGTDQNLNAPGARFVPLAEATATAFNRFYPYAVAARLAALAAAHELQASDTAQDAMPEPISRCA